MASARNWHRPQRWWTTRRSGWAAPKTEGTNYFVIQYGELPYGCEFCEWFFLYDAKGQLLNHAAPPLREQDGQQSPNNDEYEHKLEELGLKHPELVPFQP